MTTLDQHQSGEFVKLLYVGVSGSGKTGSLVSLMPSYDLRIIDMDNGLDALVNHARAECPNRLASVEFETLRDKYKATPAGPKVSGVPRAFVSAINLLDKWSDGSKPEEWGPEKVLVIDSLTALGKAAFEWAVAQNPTSRDPRQWYKGAQDVIDNVIATITSEIFRTNVIVCTHIDLVESEGGATKGYASSIGKALGPKLPRYFNTMLLAETSGFGKGVRRRIKTMPTAMLDLKNPAPMKIEAEYPLETGLAEIFKKLKNV